MANTTKGKLFYAEVVKGYTLKVMIDSLALTMSRTVFRATKKGFYHRNTDEAEQILFDVSFPRRNFRPYVCREELTFSLNLKHLQKMVRNVKKKDSIIMFVSKKIPDKLALAIRPCGSTSGHNSRLETVYITITRIEEPEQPLSLPEVYVDEGGNEIEVYAYPKVIDATDFQKMKKMTTVGKTVLVEIQRNNYISFYSDNGELYSSRLEFGEILDNPESDGENEADDYSEDEANSVEVETDEEETEGSEEEEPEESEEEDEGEGSDEEEDYSEDEDDEEIKGWYEAEFNMNVFGLLMKLPGLCTQMQFYAPKIERYPLKIGMQAGTLGEITVYIKDKKQVAIEQTQREQLQAEGISNTKSTIRRGKR